MPTATADDWAIVAARLAGVPDGAGRLHRLAAARGLARRRQRAPPGRGGRRRSPPSNDGPDGFFAKLRRSAPGPTPAAGDSLRPTSTRAPAAAGGAYGELATFLRDGAAAAGARGRRGRTRSGTRCTRARSSAPASTWTRPTSGASTSWPGIDRRDARDRGRGSSPGPSVPEAMAHLDNDPARSSRHRRPAGAGCRSKSDDAVAALADTHFDIPEPIRAPGMPHRADRLRRHLLHRPERGLQPAGPHVVVGARRRHRVLDLARADDRLSRGRPRPSPADRADGVPQRAAQPLAPAGVVGQRARRGLGALRRAADGRPGLPRRPGRLPRHARLPGDAGRAGRPRHRHPLRLRRAGRGRRRGVGLRQGVGRSSTAHCAHGRERSAASSSTATWAGPGRRRRTRSASGSGCSCATTPGAQAGRRVRPQGVPPLAPSTSAASAWTCSAPPSSASSPDRCPRGPGEFSARLFERNSPKSRMAARARRRRRGRPRPSMSSARCSAAPSSRAVTTRFCRRRSSRPSASTWCAMPSISIASWSLAESRCRGRRTVTPVAPRIAVASTEAGRASRRRAAIGRTAERYDSRMRHPVRAE